MCELVRRTVFIEPGTFYWKKDKRRSLAVYSSWADAAWMEISQGCPELMGRTEYGVGFRDGFVDYVYAGGTGEPPPVPPRHLWNVDFRSEEGHQRAEDWFAGYRHGAQIARDGGYRSLGTIRSSLMGMPPDGASGNGGDIWQGNGFNAQGNWPATESLPEPEVTPTPEMNAPEAPSETEKPPEATPPAETEEATETPAESPENSAPASKPVVPPPPRNLPPTIPHNLSAPRDAEPPLDLNEFNPPAEPPAASPEKTDPIVPAPLSIPDDATEKQPPAESETTTEKSTSSVRILVAPTAAGRGPGTASTKLAATHPHSRKAIGAGTPAKSQSAIRLTGATSTVEPAPKTPQTSTIRIQLRYNERPNARPLESAPNVTPFVR